MHITLWSVDPALPLALPPGRPLALPPWSVDPRPDLHFICIALFSFFPQHVTVMSFKGRYLFLNYVAFIFQL